VDGKLLILTVEGTYLVPSSDVSEVLINAEEGQQ